MSGPGKKPTALKLLTGNPGRRPLPKNEPKPQRSEPEMPMNLSAAAKRLWKRDAAMMVRLGLLTELDGDMWGAYCEIRADYARINREHRKAGYPMTIRNTRFDKLGNVSVVEKVHPLVVMRRAAEEKMRNFAWEFGTSPSGRTRISVPEAERTDPLEEFLGQG